MRSFSPVLVVLIGAVLAQGNVHHRRYVNDQDSENQIDPTGTPVEEPERHNHHHRHHHGRHHHFERVHRDSDRRSDVELSEAEETIEFHRFSMRNIRSVAEESGLCNDDVNTLLNILEENRPPFKKEDRSQWTEEQWQKSKEECDQRKKVIRALAFEQIRDQIHLTIFFDKLEAQKKLMKENIHKYIVGRLTRIAVSSGLNDSQIERFVRELESHKPVGVHWRPGMSQNEKMKNIEIHIRNWVQIKEACLRNATEAEQAQYKRFFDAVERDFARSMSGDHPRMRHHHRRPHHHHRRHHVDEEFPRDHVRRHHLDSETESVEPELHRHRHHRRHPPRDTDDREFEESPRRHHRRHHETEDEDMAPMRRHRNDQIYDSEERDQRPHRRRHHHHRRPHYVDSEERVEYAPEHHHRRHHKHRDEVSDSSEEQRYEEFEPRRHHHHRHEDSEHVDDSKARSEPYRQYRRHTRRGDAEE